MEPEIKISREEETMKLLENRLKLLPENFKREAIDFIEFLFQKREKRKIGRLHLDWAGALKEYRDQFSSLELQKKSIEWRG